MKIRRVLFEFIVDRQTDAAEDYVLQYVVIHTLHNGSFLLSAINKTSTICILLTPYFHIISTRRKQCYQTNAYSMSNKELMDIFWNNNRNIWTQHHAFFLGPRGERQYDESHPGWAEDSVRPILTKNAARTFDCPCGPSRQLTRYQAPPSLLTPA